MTIKSANKISIPALVIFVILFCGLIYLFKFNPFYQSQTKNNATGVYEDKSAGFSIVPPTGWQKLINKADEYMLAGWAAQIDANGNYSGADLNILGLQPNNPSPDAFFNDFKSTLISQHEGGQFSEIGKINSNLPNYKFTFSYSDSSGELVIARYIIAMKGINAFIAVARVTNAGKEFESAVDTSLSTFQVD